MIHILHINEHIYLLTFTSIVTSEYHIFLYIHISYLQVFVMLMFVNRIPLSSNSQVFDWTQSRWSICQELKGFYAVKFQRQNKRKKPRKNRRKFVVSGNYIQRFGGNYIQCFLFFWCFYISTLIKTKHSMGGSCIYLREWFIFMINVGKYTIHSVFGLEWTYWTPKPLLVGLVWNTGEKSKSHFLKNLPSLFWSFFEMWAFLFGSEPIYLPPECFQPLQMSQVPQPPPFCPEIRSFSPRPYLTSIVTTRRTFLMWLGRLRVFWGECCESTRIFYLKTILNIVDGRNPAPPEMYKTL